MARCVPRPALWLPSPVAQRLQVVMSCGLTPRKLALTLCFGVALGVMPLVWGTSLLCILVAHVFRLNHVALQAVNYLMYPLQLALLLPFFKLGARLFPGGPRMPQRMIDTLFRSPDLSTLNLHGWITLKSLAAWLVTVLPATLLVCGILMTVISHKKGRISVP